MKARLAATVLMLLASGCTSVPVAESPDDWAMRRQALQTLSTWSLDGRVAVASGSEGFSGGLSWRQAGQTADIDMRGPLGAGAIAIRLDGENYSVTGGQGAPVSGEEARRLTEEFVGAPLPLAALRYWLVGVPAPDAPFEESLAGGRLAALEQSGWRIQYQRYMAVGDRVLPARMELATGALRLRLSVSKWQFAP